MTLTRSGFDDASSVVAQSVWDPEMTADVYVVFSVQLRILDPVKLLIQHVVNSGHTKFESAVNASVSPVSSVKKHIG